MVLLTLKGSNIDLAVTYLTIQEDLRLSSNEIRASVFGIMQVLLSDGLYNFCHYTDPNNKYMDRAAILFVLTF